MNISPVAAMGLFHCAPQGRGEGSIIVLLRRGARKNYPDGGQRRRICVGKIYGWSTQVGAGDPGGMIEISRGLAERLEDNWEDERGADVVLS